MILLNAIWQGSRAGTSIAQAITATSRIVASTLRCRSAQRTIACVMLLGVAMVWSANSAAAAQYSVTGVNRFGNDSGYLDLYEGTTTDPAGIHREIVSDFDPPNANFPDYHIESAATASIDGLGSRVLGQISKDITGSHGGSIPVSASSRATGRYEDVIVGGPAGAATTSINMHLEGALSVGASPAIYGDSYAMARSEVSFYVNDNYVGGGFAQVEVDYHGTAVAPSTTRGGALDLWHNGATITSPEFSVPANVPFTLEVQLLTTIVASGFTNVPFNSSAASEFGDTLKFASGGPVFNVASGYSVNSADAGIENNSFGVPEPASLSLACWAPLLIAYVWRRSLRRNP